MLEVFRGTHLISLISLILTLTSSNGTRCDSAAEAVPEYVLAELYGGCFTEVLLTV